MSQLRGSHLCEKQIEKDLKIQGMSYVWSIKKQDKIALFNKFYLFYMSNFHSLKKGNSYKVWNILALLTQTYFY